MYCSILFLKHALLSEAAQYLSIAKAAAKKARSVTTAHERLFERVKLKSVFSDVGDSEPALITIPPFHHGKARAIE